MTSSIVLSPVAPRKRVRRTGGGRKPKWAGMGSMFPLHARLPRGVCAWYLARYGSIQVAVDVLLIAPALLQMAQCEAPSAASETHEE